MLVWLVSANARTASEPYTVEASMYEVTRLVTRPKESAARVNGICLLEPCACVGRVSTRVPGVAREVLGCWARVQQREGHREARRSALAHQRAAGTRCRPR